MPEHPLDYKASETPPARLKIGPLTLGALVLLVYPFCLGNVDEQTWHGIEDVETAVQLGDAIRRDYDSIDYGILWRATRNELPRLLQTVEDLVTLLRQ